MTAADVRAAEAESWFDPAGFLLATDNRDQVVGFHWNQSAPATPTAGAPDRRGVRARGAPGRTGRWSRPGADHGRLRYLHERRGMVRVIAVRRIGQRRRHWPYTTTRFHTVGRGWSSMRTEPPVRLCHSVRTSRSRVLGCQITHNGRLRSHLAVPSSPLVQLVVPGRPRPLPTVRVTRLAQSWSKELASGGGSEGEDQTAGQRGRGGLGDERLSCSAWPRPAHCAGCLWFRQTTRPALGVDRQQHGGPRRVSSARPVR